jgi:RimJ/RimL family protein N-acetyltransferase
MRMDRPRGRSAADTLATIPQAEKAGFVAEGCKRQAVFKGGKYDNVILMSVLRPEWQARPAT